MISSFTLPSHLSGGRLSAFVDGEMGSDEAHRWRLHLLTCVSCTQAVTAERTVRNRMQHACSPVPPSSLISSLRVVAVHDRIQGRMRDELHDRMQGELHDRVPGFPGGRAVDNVGRPERRPRRAAMSAGATAGLHSGAAAVARRGSAGVVVFTTTAATAAVVALAVTGGVAQPVPDGASPAVAEAVTPAAPAVRAAFQLVPTAVAPAGTPAVTATAGPVATTSTTTAVNGGTSTGGWFTYPAAGARPWSPAFGAAPREGGWNPLIGLSGGGLTPRSGWPTASATSH